MRQKFPNIPRRVSGYNLNYLLPENGFHVARALVGSEGTCVTVLEATCRLVESPQERVLLVIAWPDIFLCADNVPLVMSHKPIGLEGFDDILVNATRRRGINPEGLALLPEGSGWLLVEFGAGTAAEAEASARALMQTLERSTSPPNMRLLTDWQQMKRVWEVRESGLGVTSHVPGEPLTLGRLGRLRRRSRQAWKLPARFAQTDAALFGYQGSFYGHFGHACIHTRIEFRSRIEEGIHKFRALHGRGCGSRRELRRIALGRARRRTGPRRTLPKMFGPELCRLSASSRRSGIRTGR